MTTGRINQVTILNPDAGAREPNPPKGAESTKQGVTKATPITRSESAQGVSAASNRFNCPHWVPQGTVRDGLSMALPPNSNPQHTALRRREHTPRHAHEGADTRQGYPQESGRYLALPAIHRPQGGARWRISGTSVAHPKYRRNTKALLLSIGVSQPVQVTRSRRAPDNAQTRVNVAGRYLGNKACSYETRKGSVDNNELGSDGAVTRISNDAQKGILGGGSGKIAVSIPRPEAYTPYRTPKGAGGNWVRENLNCPPYVLYDRISGCKTRRGVKVSEKKSELDLLYDDPGRHAQLHINYKSIFAVTTYCNVVSAISTIFFRLYLVSYNTKVNSKSKI